MEADAPGRQAPQSKSVAMPESVTVTIRPAGGIPPARKVRNLPQGMRKVRARVGHNVRALHRWERRMAHAVRADKTGK